MKKVFIIVFTAIAFTSCNTQEVKDFEEFFKTDKQKKREAERVKADIRYEQFMCLSDSINKVSDKINKFQLKAIDEQINAIHYMGGNQVLFNKHMKASETLIDSADKYIEIRKDMISRLEKLKN